MSEFVVSSVIVALMIWRVAYGVRHAWRDRTASISRWTEPWMV